MNYIFRLHLVCGGYAYFSTLSSYVDEAEHGREVRIPSVSSPLMPVVLERLGHSVESILEREDYHRWLLHYGWAVVPAEVARKIMPQWLKKRTCLKTHAGTYTDCEICSLSTLKRSASDGKKGDVLARDGDRCLLCGGPFSQINPPTMQHIRPYSRGGETTTRNLASLCGPCNQLLADQDSTFLYDKIGLPNGIDMSLLKGNKTSEIPAALVNICDNMMTSRCEAW